MPVHPTTQKRKRTVQPTPPEPPKQNLSFDRVKRGFKKLIKTMNPREFAKRMSGELEKARGK